jgi:hypothetical protein
MTDDPSETISYSLGRIHARKEPPRQQPSNPVVAIADYEAIPQLILEKQLVAMSLARVDIEAAWAMAEMLRERPSALALLDRERRAFIEAIVIAYGRPFSRGPAQLSPAWPGYPDESARELHAYLMEERHGFVGHSDPSRRELTIQRDSSDGWEVSVTLPQTLMRPGELERVQVIFADLWNRLLDQLELACDALLKRDHAVTIVLPRQTS